MAERVVRPRHAATLVLIRGEGSQRRVLMGTRGKGHVFMPNIMVYPGGAVDVGDHNVPGATELAPEVEERLNVEPRGMSPRALAMAAIRETFEEAGLMIGRGTDNPRTTRARHWKPFLAEGVEPTLDSLAYVARAITPPGLNRRYDTRFFVATADAIFGDPDDMSRADNELVKTGWYPVEDILNADVRGVTRRGLQCALNWLDTPPPERAAIPIPYATMSRGKRRIAYI